MQVENPAYDGRFMQPSVFLAQGPQHGQSEGFGPSLSWTRAATLSYRLAPA
jgi:acyl-CoA reductase-like NAD-dependent aldehyde dehydrogenase